jgi:hypothetical protein
MRVLDVQSSATAIAGSGSSLQKGLQQALTNSYFLEVPPRPPVRVSPCRVRALMSRRGPNLGVPADACVHQLPARRLGPGPEGPHRRCPAPTSPRTRTISSSLLSLPPFFLSLSSSPFSLLRIRSRLQFCGATFPTAFWTFPAF